MDDLFEWSSITQLVDWLSSNAPRLSTVRIAVQTMDDCVSDRMLVPTAQLYCIQTLENEKSRNPSITLAGLPLVQRGEGFHIGCTWPMVQDVSSPQESTMYHNMHHSDLPIHGVSKTGPLLYAKDQAEKYMWQEKDIIESLNELWTTGMRPGSYGPDLLRKFPPERAAVSERMPYELMDWVEKRGEDARNWDV
jgi:hypothetical protein